MSKAESREVLDDDEYIGTSQNTTKGGHESESLGVEDNEDAPHFPYSIVWTTLPGISWVLPFIGHTGICEY